MNTGKDLVVAKMEPAVVLLAQADTVGKAKKVKDLAAAAARFARAQGLGAEAEMYARAIVIEAELLMGRFLKEAESAAGRPRKINDTGLLISERPETLAELGVSPRESAEAQMLVEEVAVKPDLVEELKAGRVSKKGVRRERKKREQKEAIAQASRQPKEKLIVGPYDIVLADPPWRYEHCEAENREVENQYPTSSLEDIFTHFKTANPTTKRDVILFLWATAPKLAEALQVMEEWGFDYRSCAVWDKESIGMGYWWRIQHELLLVGVRGKPGATPESERISSVFREKRTKHSCKPECVYGWIERAFPGARKLEMYQRKAREGWGGWGNECE